MRSQEDTREKFDFDLYTKTRFGKLNFIRPNGNIVFVMSFSEKGGGLMEEIVNKYPFYTLYKEKYKKLSFQMLWLLEKAITIARKEN